MSLAARVVAESLVAPALSAVWMRFGERDHLAAIFTTDDIAAGSHKPIHLEIGSAQEVVEPPCALNTVGITLGVPRALCETQCRTTEVPHRLAYLARSSSKRKVKVRVRGIFKWPVISFVDLVSDEERLSRQPVAVEYRLVHLENGPGSASFLSEIGEIVSIWFWEAPLGAVAPQDSISMAEREGCLLELWLLVQAS